jgi:predicted dehydrogenase
MRALIAGLGSIGRRHLRNMRHLGVGDILLYRTRPTPLEEAPDLPVLTDLGEALARKPDVVVVSNPTAHHLDVALPAAQAGHHLFVEKPLSHSWDGVENLLATVHANKLVTLVGFDLRFDPGLGKMKALLEAGSIGRVVSIQAQVGQYLPDWHPAEDYRQGVSARLKTGGGVVLDLIHELDYVGWLVGPVRQVSCFADRVSSLEIETEDTAAILLRFQSGAIGTVSLDYLQRVPSRTCRVVGETGTILWDYHAKRVAWYMAGRGWQEFEYPAYDRNDRFLAEMKHLIACVRRHEQSQVDVWAGSRTLRVALAAKESSATGRVVSLSP